jgi:hypothetical protein
VMIRAAQPLGACPGGRAPRQNWGKFEAHKWGGFTGRLEQARIDPTITARTLWLKTHPLPTMESKGATSLAAVATEQNGNGDRPLSKRGPNDETKPIIAAGRQ